MDTETQQRAVEKYSIVLPQHRSGKQVLAMSEYLNKDIIGQERAARKIGRGFNIYHAKLGTPGKPISMHLWAGPTGVGKTEMAHQLGYFLIDPERTLERAITLVECTLYADRHQLPNLVGSGRGLVGYDDLPLLSQLKIDEPHFKMKFAEIQAALFEEHGDDGDWDAIVEQAYHDLGPYLSVVALDEIEKAHHVIHQAVLNMADGGLTMTNGAHTSFTNTVLIMTCNINGRGQQDLLLGRDRRVGYKNRDSVPYELMTETQREDLDRTIYEQTKAEIKKFFPPEFVARVSRTMTVFRALTRVQQALVIERNIEKFRSRFTAEYNMRHATSFPIIRLDCSPALREKILEEGADVTMGVRNLKSVIEQYMLEPLANALLAGDIADGDDIMMDFVEGDTVVRKAPDDVHKVIIVPSPKVLGTDNA